MRASPVDLIGGYYKSDSLPWACQDTVNWLPVLAEVEGTRSLKMLKTPPGLKPYQQIGTGPIRGMHDCEGLRLIVSGRYLYQITNAGVGVPIGVIPGVGRVSMTHNQFETGYQVLVENGQPGGGYVYSTVDQTFVRITDEGYPGSISSDYLDSFLLGVEPFGRFWFHSDLATATSYNTLDRYEAEASPDKIVGLAVSGQEVVVFGQRTTEFFMNVGAATGTFQNRNTGFDRGCASRDTIAKLDNSIFWLGDDGIVYRLNGYSAQPVSTRALDQQLSRYNLAQAFAFVWEDRGHKVYYLTFPDGQTFGYDVVTGLWHRRESFGLDRWRLTHVVEWSGKKYGGDFQSGRVFLVDWDYHLEGSESIISERVSPVLSDNQSRLGIPSAELVFDTGQGPGTVAVPFPVQPTEIEIGTEWQYTGTFGSQINDVCYGDGLFVAVGLAEKQIWSSPDAESDSWMQQATGVPDGWTFNSCAYGNGKFVVSRGFNNVLTGSLSAGSIPWTQRTTTNTDAYLITIWSGENFIRLGHNGSSEWSADGVSWNNSQRPGQTANVAFNHGAHVIVLCGNGAIQKTSDHGRSWLVSSISNDPAAAQSFTGGASDGTIIRAFKYGSGILSTYTSLDAGMSFTVVQENIGSSGYQAGKTIFRTGRWIGLGATTAGLQQIQLWYSLTGLPPWMPAHVEGYTDLIAATMTALTANQHSRAVLVGVKESLGYSMTSPLLP